MNSFSQTDALAVQALELICTLHLTACAMLSSIPTRTVHDETLVVIVVLHVAVLQFGIAACMTIAEGASNKFTDEQHVADNKKLTCLAYVVSTHRMSGSANASLLSLLCIHCGISYDLSNFAFV